MGTYTFLITLLLFLVSLQYTAAIRCLRCNDVIQPRHCSRIEHCPDGYGTGLITFLTGANAQPKGQTRGDVKGDIRKEKQFRKKRKVPEFSRLLRSCFGDSRYNLNALHAGQARSLKEDDKQACVTESYENYNGQTLYNLGCMSTQRCSLAAHQNISAKSVEADIIGTHVDHDCRECCHSDLCNAAGCGMDGFPQQRGPICLNCPQSRDPAYCDVISVCFQGEVCHVEEIYEFGDLFYKTSCLRTTGHHCDSPPTYNPVEVGRRSTQREHCFFCCPDDLCNINCNTTTSVVPPAIVTTQAPTHHGSNGKEFFLMFIRNRNGIYNAIKLRAILTFRTPNAQIQVITHDNYSTSKLVSGPAEHIVIDPKMTMLENGKTSTGIIVKSNTSISVTAINLNTAGTIEGYLALPIESLGFSYIVGTFRPNEERYRQFGTSFAVGAPYDNTEVNITLSTSRVSVPGQYHREGDTITVVLDRLDTFYIETNNTNQDLTGTRIVSDKPVAVISGNNCFIHATRCNHLVEYLPPVSKWGSRFMVPPIMSSTSGFIRIISSVNNTNVLVTAKTLNKTYTISTFIDIGTNPSQPYAISSDQPVLVLLIMLEIKYGMSLVPSTNQFSNERVVTSPTPASVYNNALFANYIVVSIRSSDLSGLELRSVSGTDLSRVGSAEFPDADGEMYSFISVTCNNHQTCSIQHSVPNVKFSVLAYGFTHEETYAYPVNLVL